MKIAWIGPINYEGGVGGMGKVLLREVAAAGAEIEFFTTSPKQDVEQWVGQSSNLRVIEIPMRWQWNRWYSRKQYMAFLTSFWARARAHRRLCGLLAERHKSQRYDVVFQFSQMELLRLKKHLRQLPPLVVYPCVHAAGELTWHRRESAYARRSENMLLHYATRRFLAFRARQQSRDAKLPAMMIGMSRRFNQLMEQDYGVRPERQRVLYQPIERAGAAVPEPMQGRKLRIVFAGRISVRKGVEMLVELSKRLDDLADQVEMSVIGGHTQWSDYRKHMTELNPRVAKYLGGIKNAQLMQHFERGDLLVAPSHYEPGGIVVGEAISRGMGVVASDEVGSAEPLEGDYIQKFPAGDMSAFERGVRTMIDRLRANRNEIAAAAQAAAVRYFDPPQIASQLKAYLAEASKTC